MTLDELKTRIDGARDRFARDLLLALAEGAHSKLDAKLMLAICNSAIEGMDEASERMSKEPELAGRLAALNEEVVNG